MSQKQFFGYIRVLNSTKYSLEVCIAKNETAWITFSGLTFDFNEQDKSWEWVQLSTKAPRTTDISSDQDGIYCNGVQCLAL